ncbi:uracil-xanthine permease family protein [Azospirillum agricola]|uniref:uracil-xanthine permease family protein n=1 Tax=Azospirillum agricola TaxID=1720247 RepID=UPI000A0F2274|nr:solute carrier family 23 protein [Azospirillum agricola]SMH62417.1 nucleobase:cation symporter-2, NCS2 family [Azospirillum lipoferum]
MAKRPTELTYWVDEKPPALALVLLSLQHFALVAIFLVVSVTIARMAQLDAEAGSRLVSLTMIAGGVATILQCLGRGGLGSGFMVPATTTTILLPPAALALAKGGLPLLFGMSALAGLLVMALSRVIHRLRPLFPTEIAGFVVFMIGLTVMILAVRQLMGMGVAEGDYARYAAVGLPVLAVIVGLNVWGGRRLRLYCSLIGVVFGYALGMAEGWLAPLDLKHLEEAPLLALPQPGSFGLAFDLELLLPFLITALAMALNSVGAVTAAQKANDAEWKRPDMGNIGRGILADGLSNVVAGLLGGVGQAATSGAVGLSVATGATSRTIGLGVGILLVALSFSPKIATALLIMPPPVVGAALLSSGCFLVMNGIQVISSRMLDSRKIFVLGIALAFGLARLVDPHFFETLPHWIQPWVGSPLTVAVTLVILLNATLRIGTGTRSRVRLDIAHLSPEQLTEVVTAQGQLWAAEPETVFRVRFALQEAFDLLSQNDMVMAEAGGRRPLELQTRFDEFTFSVTLTYAGLPLTMERTRPTEDEILEDEDGMRRLASYMIGRVANRMTSSVRDGRCEVVLTFNA